MKDCLIVLSGGMDSVTMLYEYRERIALAVTFDYGSNHAEREKECARLHCERLCVRHILIPLDFMRKYFKSSLLEGADAVPEGHYSDENMASTVVPFRNGIMLSIACGMAESFGLAWVMIANHGGDHTVYADCREEFVVSMSAAMKAGTDSGVGVFAPYTNITKTEVALRGKALGLDYSETWSCYKGGERHCGKCATCIERREALEGAGIVDNTEYL